MHRFCVPLVQVRTETSVKTKEVQRLGRMCRLWGGDLRFVTESTYRAIKESNVHPLGTFGRAPDRVGPFFPAPSGEFGVHWPSRVIYVHKARWSDLTHEMYHAFATQRDPESDREKVALGWEISLVRHLGLHEGQWVSNNKFYTTSQGDLGSLSPLKLQRVLEKEIQRAQRARLVSANGVPLCVPRVVNIAALKRFIAGQRIGQRSLYKRAMDWPSVTGVQFERRLETLNFAKGYDQALHDVLAQLYPMSIEKPTRRMRSTEDST